MDKNQFYNFLLFEDIPPEVFSNDKPKVLHQPFIIVNKWKGMLNDWAITEVGVRNDKILFNKVKSLLDRSETIYFSADYAPSKELNIDTSYVCIYCYERGEWYCEIMPYCPDDWKYTEIQKNTRACKAHLINLLLRLGELKDDDGTMYKGYDED